jgi:hypothetical protein
VGAHHACYSTGTRGFLLEVKRQGRGFNHYPPSIAGLSISGSVTLLPKISFHIIDRENIIYYTDIDRVLFINLLIIKTLDDHNQN